MCLRGSLGRCSFTVCETIHRHRKEGNYDLFWRAAGEVVSHRLPPGAACLSPSLVYAGGGHFLWGGVMSGVLRIRNWRKFQHYKDRNMQARYLNEIAGRLSSKMYGNLISRGEAMRAIRR